METITDIKQPFNKLEYNRKFMTTYRIENRDKYLEQQKNQYEKNKEKRKEYQRNYDRQKRLKKKEQSKST